MVSVSPYWAALVPRWNEIAEALRADRAEPNLRKQTRCYELMRSILDPIEKSDRNVIRMGAGMTISFGRPSHV